MANVFYHKLTSGPNNGDWINISSPGSPHIFGVRQLVDDGLFYPSFTWGENTWYRVGTGQVTVTLAQTQLDTFMANLNSGTVGP